MMPIKLQVHCTLTDFGVDRSCVTFTTVTMQSQKYVCVRDHVSRRLLIVNIDDVSDTLSVAIDCKSAAINPENKLIALKMTGDNKSIQIYDYERKLVTKSFALKPDQEIIHYEWILSGTALSLVGETSVYHWSTAGDSEPQRIFDVHFTLKNCHLVSYKTDTTAKWSMLIGLSATPGFDGGCAVGHMQLYSEERQCSQAINGHAACFTRFKMENNPEPTNLLAFVNKSGGVTKLHVVEVGRPASGNMAFVKKSFDLLAASSAECLYDFPVGLIASIKHDLLYVVTAYGYLHLFDLLTGVCFYTNKISENSLLITTPCQTNSGIYCIDKIGRVLSVGLEENNLIPYIIYATKNQDLALKMALRDKTLKGSEAVFIDGFHKLFTEGRYHQAAKLVAAAPNEILRTESTLRLFQNAPNACSAAQEQTRSLPSPVLQYFGVLLDSGLRLNAYESIEICKLVINQGKMQLLEKWLREDKIQCTEKLGDMIKSFDPILALSVYLRSNAAEKVMRCFVESGQLDKIILYCKKIGHSIDPVKLLADALTVTGNADRSIGYAKALVEESENDEKKYENIGKMADIFRGRDMIQNCTAFLLDVLKEDRPNQGSLQTKLIEINLLSGTVQLADAILGNKMFSYYDKYYVGRLCEKAGLMQRALENYTDLDDIKRVVVQTNRLNGDWLVEYFRILSAEDALDCLKAMLSTDTEQNLQVCLRICDRFYNQLTVTTIIELFEKVKCYEGLFLFLESLVNSGHHYTSDESVHFKYLQSACITNRFKEVERICRESSHYNPEKVKNYLKEIKLPDHLPLIIVCDRFNYVKEVVFFLYNNNLQKYIEIYVQKLNQSRLPEVVGALMDVDCNEECIRHLIMSMKNGQFSPERLIEEVERRNRLKLLLEWLEWRVDEGSTDSVIHDAIAKIYVDSSNKPERFLKENPHYNSITVGKYCEKKDPHLACIAYERGNCDILYINVCYENNLFKSAARYLVKRCELSLWNKVLRQTQYLSLDASIYNDDKNITTDSSEDDTNRFVKSFNYNYDIEKCKRQLIDQVVHSALSETHDPEEISITVRAFMSADLPDELMEILEKIILDNTVFCDHRNLQNLLILTAIKCDKNRVMDYVNRLDNYDVKEVATICVNSKLFEEAFSIYKKFNYNTFAAKVLIENIQSLDRAYELAECCNESDVWSLLGKAQLQNNFIKDGIDSFIRAKDASSYMNVVEAASRAERWHDLANYLQMAYKNISKGSYVESELIYCYAKTDRLADLEEFVIAPNNADILKIGNRCFDEGLYESAKILYENISNYAKLAITLAKLKEFQGAVDNARKANCIKTWKSVCFGCLADGEQRLSQLCGLNIVMHSDELSSLIEHYEANGYVNELVELLETALGLERAHIGIFTELSLLYARYKPDKMKEHVDLFWDRINIPKVLKAANEAHLWPVTVFLYERDEDYDSAVMYIMEHPTETWKENHFKDVIAKVINTELYYRAIQFYLEYKPLSVNDLMMVLSSRIDQSRAINVFSENGLIHLLKPHLISMQDMNDKRINNVLNDIYIDEEDYRSLKSSIDLYDNFDRIGLAKKLEKHELVEFRRISAFLYKTRNWWNKSIDICEKEGLYKDAMKYAAESKDPNISVDLLYWFLQKKLPDHFTACLHQCYDLLQPDVVLELSWRFKVMNFAMPYFIQVMNEYINKIDRLSAITASRQQHHQLCSNNIKSINNYDENPQLMMIAHSKSITALDNR